MSHLYYVPLEPISGRYTEQWSRANTGWLERNWQRAGVQYTRIEGPEPFTEIGVGVGKVLNPLRRAEWGFAQTQKIMQMIVAGTITKKDVIFFSDFWHPGLEMIAQLRDTLGICPRLYSFCHAQSVDQYDFMHKNRLWARPIENGFAHIYEGIFVNNDYLRELLCIELPDIGRDRVHTTGHVFSSEEVKEVGCCYLDKPKENIVVFSSRFDKEKQPHLFMDVVEEYHKNWQINQTPAIDFVICSGGKLKSDDSQAMRRVRGMVNQGLLRIEEDLSKSQYYHWLARAKIQLSTSLQDWVSFCLLEAVTFNCYPLYPNFRSFPEAFGPLADQLYPFHPSMEREKQVQIICQRIGQAIEDYDRLNHQLMFDTVVARHNTTWKRQLDIMGVKYDGDEKAA